MQPPDYEQVLLRPALWILTDYSMESLTVKPWAI